MRKLKVGTRGSKLAMAQAKQALTLFQQAFPEIELELVKIKTKGDHLATHSLQAIGGQGAFVREIETQLCAGKIDLAIHSLKDVPTTIHDQLVLGCIMQRKSAIDVLIVKDADQTLSKLAENAIVGTSSLRRKAQLLHLRPDLSVEPIRGNIDTRIRKLEAGEYDAIVLALAGLERLGLDQTVYHEKLSPELMLPAIGQGALAIECRKADQVIIDMLKLLEHQPTALAVTAERSFLSCMDGSCTFPVGAYGRQVDDTYELTGMIGSENGKVILKETLRGDEPITLGKRVAAQLIEAGAIELIEECRNDQ